MVGSAPACVNLSVDTYARRRPLRHIQFIVMANNKKTMRLCRHTTQAKNKNTMTIAPFVESAEALSQIWSINIDFVSGDFFREPNENLEYDFSSAA